MRRSSLRWVFLFLLGAGPCGLVYGQGLGEMAAREKARRAAEKAKSPKPARVYTEEDLKALEGNRPSESAPAAPTPTQRPSGDEAPREGAEGGAESEAVVEKDESADDQWKERHRQALAQVESANQNLGAAMGEVERLKQDLNPMSTTYVTDPYKVLEIQAQLTEAEKRAEEARKQVATAQEAADQVAKEAGRNGVYIR
jgi:hypothetical protein